MSALYSLQPFVKMGKAGLIAALHQTAFGQEGSSLDGGTVVHFPRSWTSSGECRYNIREIWAYLGNLGSNIWEVLYGDAASRSVV